MTGFLKDLSHAVRLLARTPGWTAVVLLSLALGIGANTALFTAVNGLLLQTINVPHPNGLVRIKWAGANDMAQTRNDYGFSAPDGGRRVRATVSYPIYQQMRAANQTLTELAAYAPSSYNIIVDGQAEVASALEASGSFFDVFQLRPALGRAFTATDDSLSASPVAVISDAYWRKRFNSDRNVVNTIVTIGGHSVSIVGVMPQSFTGVMQLGSHAPDIIIPLAFDDILTAGQSRMNDATNWWLLLMGRLKSGRTTAQVQGNLESAFHSAAQQGLTDYMNGLSASDRQLSLNRLRGTAVPSLVVTSGAHGAYDLSTNTAQSATFLSVVVGIVLFIVCANVANLLLSRATTRQQEISIRLSMGATRWRLIQQLLTESLLLAFVGGAFGVLVGYWSLALLPFGNDASIDWHVLAFVGGLSLLTGIVFGLVPALRATRVDLACSMKESGRSVTSHRSWLSKSLLVVQVALSLVLLIGAGLFLRTLDNLRHVNVGFDPSNLLMFSLQPELNGYDVTRTLSMYDQIHERLASLPGIRGIALTSVMLLSGNTYATSMWAEDRDTDHPTVPDMYLMTVSADYFSTMGISLLKGRTFNDGDGPTSAKVAIVNEAAAKLLFPGGNALGRHIGDSLEQRAGIEIIGVVRDTKFSSVRAAAPPTTYSFWRQKAAPLDSKGKPRPGPSMIFVARTAADPNLLAQTVRELVRQVDSNVPINNMTTQADQLEKRFSQEKLFATASSLFGGLALLLACIGLFGLMSYNVARRTNEIGIRMALGAGRSAVVRLVLGESLVLVVIGIGIGIASTLAAGQLVEKCCSVLRRGTSRRSRSR
jgi:predicted permease